MPELEKFKLDSLDAAIVVILLVVPGFVMRAVTSQAFGRKRAEGDLQIVELIVRSLLCDAVLLASGMLMGVIQSNQDLVALSAATLGHLGILVLGVFVVPVMMGVLEALLIVRFRPAELLLSWMGLALRLEELAAWDKMFMGMFNSENAYRYVEITTMNNEKILGAMDRGSYASGVTGERDIYVSKVYTLRADGAFELKPQTDGVLICASDIRRIELWYPAAVAPADDVT